MYVYAYTHFCKDDMRSLCVYNTLSLTTFYKKKILNLTHTQKAYLSLM